MSFRVRRYRFLTLQSRSQPDFWWRHREPQVRGNPSRLESPGGRKGDGATTVAFSSSNTLCVPSWSQPVSRKLSVPRSTGANVGRQSPGGQRGRPPPTQPTATWGNGPPARQQKVECPRKHGRKCGSPVPWRPAGGPTPTQPTAPWGNRPPARQQKVECPRKHPEAQGSRAG